MHPTYDKGLGQRVMCSSRTVLVVDDEAVIADTLAAILRSSGYIPHVAYSGEQALSVLDTVVPDLLISDVMMPGMDGVQLSRTVTQRYPTCKVLLFSGAAQHAEILEETRSKEFEFTFLRKPIHPADLLRVIA